MSAKGRHLRSCFQADERLLRARAVDSTQAKTVDRGLRVQWIVIGRFSECERNSMLADACDRTSCTDLGHPPHSDIRSRPRIQLLLQTRRLRQYSELKLGLGEILLVQDDSRTSQKS